MSANWSPGAHSPRVLSARFRRRSTRAENKAPLTRHPLFPVLPSFAPLYPQPQVFINVALATNNAVDPSRRGAVNGLSMTLGSLAKAAGPTAASTVFAWSIHRHHPFPFDHHLIFSLMALGMVVVTAASWNVVISPVDPKPKGATTAPVVVAEEAPEEVGRSGVSS